MANSPIQLQKDTLRLQAKEKSQGFSSEKRAEASEKIARSTADLIASQKFPHPLHIASFAALPLEPKLEKLHLLLPQANLYYPICGNDKSMSFHKVNDPSTLKKGRYGIPMPEVEHHQKAKTNLLQVLLCPAWGYTKYGVRLGKGGGYYDRFMAKHPKILRIGVCFDCQILPDIPVEPHDIPMHIVLSESEVLHV